MQTRYLDTNILLSYWFDEVGEGLPVPFGYHSKKLLETAVACKYALAISKLTVLEVETAQPVASDSLRDEIAKFRQLGKIEVFEVPPELQSSACELNRKLAKAGLRIGVNDCIHLLLAKSNNLLLVTWDRQLQAAALRSGVKVSEPVHL